MTRRLQTLADGKVIAVLEGGYNLEATALAAEATVRTLLGEQMPLKCSHTGFTPEHLVNNIFLSPSNYNDLTDAKATWTKYWPLLSTNQDLVSFEDSSTAKTKLRQRIAGPSDLYPLASYEFSDTTFSKLVPDSEVNIVKAFVDSNPSCTAKLIEVIPGTTIGRSRVILENLYNGIEYSVVGNLVLHRVNFDPEIEEEEKEYVEMGHSLFQLNWAVKEIITQNPIKFA